MFKESAFYRNKGFNLFIYSAKIFVIITNIISCAKAFSKMLIIVSMKTETCLLTLRLERYFSQSNNSMACLVRSVFDGW